MLGADTILVRMGETRYGAKALAGFAGLRKLEGAIDAYRLYLAGALLDDGLPPREMLAELGLDRTIRPLDKFDPDQPRVPTGSGRESGQWTKDGSFASTSADEDHKVQLAGDVIHVGTLTNFFVIHGPDGIPRTFCQYRSAFGYFERSRLGIWKCPGIWLVAMSRRLTLRPPQVCGHYEILSTRQMFLIATPRSGVRRCATIKR